MFRTLSNKIICTTLLVFFITSLLNTENHICFHEINKGIELQTLCEGIVIKNSTMMFKHNPLKNVQLDSLNFKDILNSNYSLIVTSSPYLCGGCNRSNIRLVNYFAEKYPKQVLFIVENWFYKDTLEKLDEINLSNKIRILLDENGENIQNLTRLNEELNSFFFLILDQYGNIIYLVGNSYYFSITEDIKSNIIHNIENYLQNK